jgi:hypothetical protein
MQELQVEPPTYVTVSALPIFEQHGRILVKTYINNSRLA